jgi:hypothetical protein
MRLLHWECEECGAHGRIEWWQRMKPLHWFGPDDTGHWRASLTELTPNELRWLGEEFEAGYLVTESEPPLALKRIYPTDPSVPSAYAVYELSP